MYEARSNFCLEVLEVNCTFKRIVSVRAGSCAAAFQLPFHHGFRHLAVGNAFDGTPFCSSRSSLPLPRLDTLCRARAAQRLSIGPSRRDGAVCVRTRRAARERVGTSDAPQGMPATAFERHSRLTTCSIATEARCLWRRESQCVSHSHQFCIMDYTKSNKFVGVQRCMCGKLHALKIVVASGKGRLSWVRCGIAGAIISPLSARLLRTSRWLFPSVVRFTVYGPGIQTIPHLDVCVNR